MARSNRRSLLFRTIFVLLFMGACPWLSAQRRLKSAALPDAPEPQVASGAPDAHKAASDERCQTVQSRTGKVQKNAGKGCVAWLAFFQPIVKPPGPGPLTPKKKLRLAVSDVTDPFNLITIGGTAAITIGSDSHTDYGPGMKGWAKNAGTLLTEDMTSEFFSTFLVPSLTWQDPRYYRMPKASIQRRIVHAIVQPVWTKSDMGIPMPNFGNLIGVPASIAVANIYVPGRRQGVGPTAESSAIAIGSAPIDNFISEFLPDVARHVNIHIVFIQRIVNQIALTRGPV